MAELVLEDGGEEAIREQVEQIHEEDLGRTLDRMVTFVHGHYERLDDLTAHGVRPLPDRDGFFSSLYSSAALRQAGFPKDLLSGDPADDAGPAAPGHR
jgi:hypothetical protein